jgi:hypothetical protein
MNEFANFKKIALSTAIVGMFLTGCGGGGGGGANPVAATTATLSGTVAGGAAVIGTVVVTDSLGATKGGTIEANGHYSVDVTGMTGPFMLKAAGTVGNTSVTYYSAATSSDVNGTVNVTPFTNLIVSNIAAQLAENYFASDQHANFATLFTPAKLADAQTALLNKLQPVLAALGVSSSIDLLRATFAADHSGMDAVLDMVKVQTDTATNLVTLQNAITGGTIATDDTTTAVDNSTAASGSLAGITPAAVTDLQAITAGLDKFSALFATALPTSSVITNSGLFDTSSAFIEGGKTFAEFASQISTDPTNVGLKFSNVAISLDASGTAGTLTALVKGSNWSNMMQQRMVKSAGVWKIQGNGRLVELNAKATAELAHWKNFNQSLVETYSGSDPIHTGVYFHIDPKSYNATHTDASTAIATALVTGPGLDSAGVVFENGGPNTWMRLPNYVWNTNTVAECGHEINGNHYIPIASQCITVASAVDNSEYTVVLKNAAGTSLNGAGYKVILPKQPRLSASLTAADFPDLTSASIDGNTNVTPRLMVQGKSLAVAWKMPATLTPNWASVWSTDTTGASYSRVEKQLPATATSTIFALGTPASAPAPDEANLWIEGTDVFGRNYGVGYYQKIN